MSSESDHENEDFYMDIYHDQGDKNDEVVQVDDEEDKVDEGNEEDEKEEEAGENEDVDEEADKRYWEAKAKEGVHRVCRVISEAITMIDNINKFTAKEKKSGHTRYTAHFPARRSPC